MNENQIKALNLVSFGTCLLALLLWITWTFVLSNDLVYMVIGLSVLTMVIQGLLGSMYGVATGLVIFFLQGGVYILRLLIIEF